MALKMLGCLALLMFGMKSMSEALQKMAGPQLRHVLGTMTTNRFTGMLTGMFVTASVQSSTATTLMTVSFVNAGLLTLMQAISIILGAHIGTTVTAWIMSLGFSFNIANFVYPAFFIGIILVYCSVLDSSFWALRHLRKLALLWCRTRRQALRSVLSLPALAIRTSSIRCSSL